MRHDVAVVIDDEDAAAADAVVLQAVENRIERNDGREHSREIIVCISSSGTAITNAGRLSGASARGSLRNFTDCTQLLKARCSALATNGIPFCAEISLRSAGAFAIAANRGQVDKRIAIGVDEIFKQPRDFGLATRIFHVLDQTRSAPGFAAR